VIPISKPTIGFALTGSFCTIRRVFPVIEALTKEYRVIPIVSERVALTDTRFISASETLQALEELCGAKPMSSIFECEPIGPQKLLDLLIICPCTGNSLSKIALGITDTAVTMAFKAHRRNNGPVLIGISSNDALSGSAANLGKLLNQRGLYFVPFGQDNPENKETSLICDFGLIPAAALAALEGRQLQPLILPAK